MCQHSSSLPNSYRSPLRAANGNADTNAISQTMVRIFNTRGSWFDILCLYSGWQMARYLQRGTNIKPQLFLTGEIWSYFDQARRIRAYHIRILLRPKHVFSVGMFCNGRIQVASNNSATSTTVPEGVVVRTFREWRPLWSRPKCYLSSRRQDCELSRTLSQTRTDIDASRSPDHSEDLWREKRIAKQRARKNLIRYRELLNVMKF